MVTPFPQNGGPQKYKMGCANYMSESGKFSRNGDSAQSDALDSGDTSAADVSGLGFWCHCWFWCFQELILVRVVRFHWWWASRLGLWWWLILDRGETEVVHQSTARSEPPTSTGSHCAPSKIAYIHLQK